MSALLSLITSQIEEDVDELQEELIGIETKIESWQADIDTIQAKQETYQKGLQGTSPEAYTEEQKETQQKHKKALTS